MKKLIITMMIGLMITTASGVSEYGVSSERIQKILDTSMALVETIEGEEVEYVSHEFLYGLSGEKDYVYIVLSKGYIIANSRNGALSEYDIHHNHLMYSRLNTDYCLYAGPLNYFTFNNSLEMNAFIASVSKELFDKNQEYLDATSCYSSEELKNLSRNDWEGIPSWKMAKYSSGMWVNDSTNYPPSQGYGTGGICGTIATAGLLAYYQDYVNSNYVPSTMRTQYSSNPGTLISTLFTFIDQLHPNGTIGSHLKTGGNNFLQTYYSSCTYQFTASIFNVWSKIKTKITAGYPIVIGLFGHPIYGNHWVLGYRYYDDTGDANDQIIIVDNHGSYTATINKTWLSEYVMINN